MELSQRFVPTDQNPNDLGTCGIAPANLREFWLNGPTWLYPNHERKCYQSRIESDDKGQTGMNIISSEEIQVLEATQNHFLYYETIDGKRRFCGPLQTEKIKAAEVRWLKITQDAKELRCPFQLKLDNFGLFRCHGRVLDCNSRYGARERPLATSIIEHNHKEEALHRGVQGTMSKVRERFLIPQLRRIQSV